MAQAEKTIGEPEFRRRAGDQTKNRGAAEALEATSARLGDVGVALRKDLIRASASLRSAEQSLGKTEAAPAADLQSAALDILAKARDEFSRSIERLLVELRAELQSRLITEFTEIHELQAGIREATQAQAPRVAQKSRTALVMVTGLSKNQAEMGERTEHLLALVEETEYGIALPTTLRILSREMRTIEGWLKAADVAPRTIRARDEGRGRCARTRPVDPTSALAGNATGAGRSPSLDGRVRERELNRLIAELKMVRMIQARLNDDTVAVDKARPSASTPPPALRREVETLEATQEEIRDALAKISERLPVPELGQ